MTLNEATMDVTVEAGHLADAMAWVRAAAATRPRVPTLTGAHLSIVDGLLRVAAHDGTRHARFAEVPATGTTTHCVTFNTDPGTGTLTVRTRHVEETTISHTLPCTSGTTTPVQVSFNPDHLPQALKAANSTTANLRFDDQALNLTNPGVVVIDTDYRTILQPLRGHE